MARSVVLRKSVRCPQCQLPPRWCICAAQRDIASPLGVTVLQHFMESYRPSSTGHLIKRVLPAAGLHLYRKEHPPARADLAPAEKEIWILHPNGEPMPTNADLAHVQAVLIDGTWVQATEMARAVAPPARRVSLPMVGESRYWLRAQSGPGRFSTVEALLFLLKAVGLADVHAQLRLQFELHVFASLCARGQKATALDYLVASPVQEAFPELIAKLTRSRRD